MQPLDLSETEFDIFHLTLFPAGLARHALAEYGIDLRSVSSCVVNLEELGRVTDHLPLSCRVFMELPEDQICLQLLAMYRAPQ